MIDRALHETGRDPLAGTVPLAVVGDLARVAPQVGRKLIGRGVQPPELASGFRSLGSVLLGVLGPAPSVIGQFLSFCLRSC